MFGFTFLHNLFSKVEHTAVQTFLPFLERGVGDFFVNALPVAETIVLSLIRNKGSISTADRDAAAIQIKNMLVSEADQMAVSAGTGTQGVQITDGLARLALDLAYHKLKFTGAIAPANSANVGISPNSIEPLKAVRGPAPAA
jgi:hypothetical protein